MKKNLLDIIAQSAPAQILVTLLIYSFYGSILGLSLAPSIFLVGISIGQLLVHSIAGPWILLTAITIGLSVYLYFIVGVIVMGSIVRVMSLGIKPGRYPQVSLTMLRWLIYSGVYHMAGSTILNYIPMSFFTNLFFQIVGAKIGKNVFINTWFLNDAYLLTIGDDVVIGGKTDISCHTFERGMLVLSPVTIGRGTLVGTHCYISPGVTIGERCVIGQYSFIRKGRTFPDRSNITAVSGLDVRDAVVVENIRRYLPVGHSGGGSGNRDGGDA